MKYDTNLKLVTPPGHVITFTGKVINLFNPDPAMIVLEDIAHALSNTCRWNGHTKTFYSVAEHCVRVMRRLPQPKKITALFHDAEEAYWGDIINPIKNILPVEVITKIVEFRQVIFDKFNVPPIDDEVDAADKAEMLWDCERLIYNFKHVGLHQLKAKQQWYNAAILLTKSY